MADMTLEQAQAMIAALTSQLAKVQSSKPKGNVPFASVVKYTTKGKGETAMYLRLSTSGQEWGSTLLKLEAGDKLTATGRAALAEFAKGIGELAAKDTIEVGTHGVKKTQ